MLINFKLLLHILLLKTLSHLGSRRRDNSWLPQKAVSNPTSRNSLTATMEDLTGDRHLNVIKIVIFFLLCSMIVSFGPMTYLLLHNAEFNRYTTTFRSISHLISNSISGSIQRKIEAGNFVDSMFASAIDSDKKQTLPNFTMLNFEKTINKLVKVANCRYITFAPLVDNTTRNGWEAYAAKNVHLLNGPPSLSRSINGSWVVADGIYNLSSELVRSRDTGYMGESSQYPRWMFPIWQVAPIAYNSDLIMADSHAIKFEHRQDSIDKALTSRNAVFTGFVQLIPDLRRYGPSYSRPSTIIFYPIISIADGHPVVGMFSGAFSWDIMLSGILHPTYKQVRCVMTSYESKFIVYQFANICDSEHIQYLINRTLYLKELSLFYSTMDMPIW